MPADGDIEAVCVRTDRGTGRSDYHLLDVPVVFGLVERSDYASGDSNSDTTSRNVFCNDSPSTYYCVVPDTNAPEDRAIATDPDPLPDPDLQKLCFQFIRTVIVPGGRDHRIRADLSLLADLDATVSIHLYETVQRGTVVNAYMTLDSGAQIDSVLQQAVRADVDVGGIDHDGSFTDNRVPANAPMDKSVTKRCPGNPCKAYQFKRVAEQGLQQVLKFVR
jgi:hypothetical protein